MSTVRITDPQECGEPRIMAIATLPLEQARALEQCGHVQPCDVECCAEDVWHLSSPWEQVAHAIDRIEASR